MGSNGFTSLHIASWLGHKSICKFLLNNGAATEAKWKEKEDNTALHLAIRAGNWRIDCWEIVRILSEFGASTNIKNSDGYNALEYSLIQNSFIQRKRLNMFKVILYHQ